ncbi:DUF5642 family protein [Mycobacterium sp. SM1]|uniref:DUF5642 family protein n=1 Tax=Mycobacterium sp. SM1 TaxID=2816243 RepID=UPI001BCD50B9|nr:DUF5642 family protein [Mycobacterium sp. SM1]MBS4729163.1 DUF5642 family protein [Mycobacterium sp. SM1]
MFRAALVITCAGALAACAPSRPAASVDIGKVLDVKASFGPQFRVTSVAPTGINPTLFAAQKLPPGMTFEPADCAKFALGQSMPPGLRGNMAAVSAEGAGNRFITIAVQTSQPVPITQPGRNCQKVGFAGGQLRGVIEVVGAPQIADAQTLGVHRVLQTVLDGKPSTGELYDYSAHFGSYQVIVTANPLVVPDKPVAPVDTQRARDLLVKAVAAIRS